MMMVSHVEIANIHSFIVLAVILAATPGIDMMLVIKHAMVAGWRAGMATMLGVAVGSFVWTVAAAIGLVTVITALTRLTGAPIFDGLLVIGMLYMIWIGMVDIRAGWLADPVSLAVNDANALSVWRAGRDGFSVNMLNPKVGLFYVTVVPQFVSEDAPVLVQFMGLGMVHIASGVVILGICALAAGRLHYVVAGGQSRRIMLVVSGVMIILFAVLLGYQRVST